MSKFEQQTSLPEPALVARGLKLVRGGRPILTDASVALQDGAFTVVLGSNGAGKSTLLKCLTGEHRPDEGSVHLRGRRLSEWASEELALARAVLAQKTPLTFPFEVAEVVALGRLAHRRHSDATIDGRAVARSLEQVDLMGFETRRYTTLSGGEQQRTQLARILAQIYSDDEKQSAAAKPLLFLDEPISALDIRHQCRILGTARNLANEGHAVFAVLHDLNYALRFADRLILMREGRIIYDVTCAACRPAMLEEIFGVSLNRIPDPSSSDRDFYFPNHPKPDL